MTTPADWYQDPEGAPGDLRYWDGTQWTEHRAPANRPAEPAPVAPPPPPTPEPPAAPPAPPEPTITPGVAAGMGMAAAPPPPAAAPPAATPPPSTPMPAAAPPVDGAVPPAAGAATKSRAPLFIAIAIVVVVLLVGGVVAALVLGGGSSKKSPSAWASSFCKNKDVTSSAKAIAAAQDSLQGEDLDQLATFLDSMVKFLEVTASTTSSLGAPDIPNGKAMIDELPKAMRSAATQLKSVASDLRDGDMSSLDEMDDFDPISGVSPQAKTAWDQIGDEIDSNPDCSAIAAALADE